MTICSKAIAKYLVYFILSTCIFTLVSCKGNGLPIPPIPGLPKMTVMPGSGSPRAVFRISDSCNDGVDIEYRFFEYDGWINSDIVARMTKSGVWPGSGRVYVTRGFGKPSREHTLGCTAGRGVCFGGKSRDQRQIRWGAGIDGDENCPGCCIQCPTSGTVTYPGGRLTCN